MDKSNSISDFNLEKFVKTHQNLADLHDEFIKIIMPKCNTWNEALAAVLLTTLQCQTRIIEAYEEQNINPEFVTLLSTAGQMNLCILMNFDRAVISGI